MKQNKLVLMVSLVILLLAGSILIAAAAGSPGSQDDPVVTKSYVDQKIAQLSGGIPAGGGSPVFTVIEVEAGKKVIGAEGTEMILRGGEAVALDNGVDGISDVTSGTDLKKGTVITRNHHLLVPKADGRGIQATAKIWVMVKGAYTIE